MTAERPRLDLVFDVSDHLFAKTKPLSSKCMPLFIQREWELLTEHLPETIYVQTYETRVDLLRAAIIGAQGTPYHDGLFFFDICLPHDYPSRPPLVKFRSYGVFRINPNIYPNGSICLSLLDTWHGKSSESWNPKQSNLLQVLLSLQALILNDKPYFNEPQVAFLQMDIEFYNEAFRKISLPNSEEEALAYNEYIFMITWKCMFALLRQPPKNCEALIKDHFKRRARLILQAFNAYIEERARIGMYNNTQQESNASGDQSQGLKGEYEVSSVFKLSMKVVHKKLLQEFAKIGAEVQDFVEMDLRETTSCTDLISVLVATGQKDLREVVKGKAIKPMNHEALMGAIRAYHWKGKLKELKITLLKMLKKITFWL